MCHHKCPSKRQADGDEELGGENSEDGAERDRATSRGVLTGTKSWERRGLDSLPELLGEDGPANTLVSAFWPPEL